jgi:hypothetical protein
MIKTITKILEFELISIDNYKIRVFTLLSIFLVYILTRIALYLIRKALFRKNLNLKHDDGNSYALFQIIKYVV